MESIQIYCIERFTFDHFVYTLIITGISNEKANELSIYGIL